MVAHPPTPATRLAPPAPPIRPPHQLRSPRPVPTNSHSWWTDNRGPVNTFRDHLILEYEVPKYDGDMGQPNLFVPLDDDLCRRKITHLMTHFSSQLPKRWFKEDLFSGVLRLRGMECNSPTSFAEAFYCRKAVLA